MSEANPALDPIGYRCTRCGHLTKVPSADLSAIRAKGARSCCPERNMVGLSDRTEELERMLGLVDDQRREWERHCKRAEAKLAKAVEALQWCATVHDSSRARTTLAELKGQDQCQPW